MKWDLEYSDSAKKYLKLLAKPDRERIERTIDKLRDGPFNRKDLDIKMLNGRDEWRLRVGKYRVIYAIYRTEILISVIKIAPRGDVYKD
ncbi:MAG: type II toxin-antitoxin system RelE/ParE family toxin [Synergistaceae bacterium]|nr:type II toxin-antitoxin system RelE/ParE family toxin [Synergistaceae bacterium]MBR2209750.1 type II toxin-antitoxin system RelE/ParE family toxin [Synergistaceae bacterium]